MTLPLALGLMSRQIFDVAVMSVLRPRYFISVHFAPEILYSVKIVCVLGFCHDPDGRRALDLDCIWRVAMGDPWECLEKGAVY